MFTTTQGRLRLGAFIALVASVLTFTGVASAEIDAPQQAAWGLKTEAPSSTIAGWAALGWGIEEVGGTMFVGGKFAEVTNGTQTESQPYFAAFDSGDGRFLSWIRPDVGGPVLALEEAPDGNLFAGGEIKTWNGTTFGALVKVNSSTGEAIASWPTRVSGGSAVVRDIRLEHDGWLYVVGAFTRASDGNGSRAVDGAIRVNPDTGRIDWNWVPDVNGGSVWGVSVSHTRSQIYLAGWFTDVGGAANTRGFAATNTSGQVVRDRSTIPFNTCATCTDNYRLYDVIATTAGDVWTVGEQHSLFILDESDLDLKLHHYTGCNINYQENCNRRGGEFQELEELNGRMYAAGHYWGSHMTSTETIWHNYNNPAGTYTGSVSAVTAYNISTGQRIQSFNPRMAGNGGGFGLEMSSDGCLWAVGDINTVGSATTKPARDMVRLCDTGGAGPDPSPTPTPPTPTNCSVTEVGNNVRINWSNDGSDQLEGTVIRRSVNGGNLSWRGFVAEPGTSFTEPKTNDSISYQVEHRFKGQWYSQRVDCGSVEPPAQAMTCSVALTQGGDGAVVQFENAVGSVVIRTNGSWLTTLGNRTSGSYTDNGLDPGTHHYSVRSWLNGTRTDAYCGSVTVEDDAQCTAVNWTRGIAVRWESQPGKPVVRRNGQWIADRSVGGTYFWDANPPAGTHNYVIRFWHEGNYTDVTCPAVTRP